MNRPWRVIVGVSKWAMFGETVLGAYATREAAFTQAAARAVADVRAFRDATPTGDTAARYYVQNKATGERWSVQPIPEASPKS